MSHLYLVAAVVLRLFIVAVNLGFHEELILGSHEELILQYVTFY